MTTHEARALYSDLLDGELSPEDLARWHAQLGDDTALAADYAGFAASVGALRGLRPAALSEARVAAILAPLEAGDAAHARPARWPRAVAALLSAAALWWLFAFGGWGFLLAERVAPTSDGVVAELRHDDVAPRTLDVPSPALDTPHVQLAVAEPAETADTPSHGLQPLVPDARRPRLRGSAGLRLVRGEDSTRLSVRGELGAVVPELLLMLDDPDPELAQLAAARLALLQDDLVERELLPDALGVHPLVARERAQPLRRGWFGAEPEPPTASAAWHAWWDAAREHLPRAHDSDVL